MADQNRDDRVEPAVNESTSNTASADGKPAESTAASSDAATGQDKPKASENDVTATASEPAAAKATGNHIMVLPPVRDGHWSAGGEEAAAAQGPAKPGLFGKRRLAALAAVFALAAVAGVIGGTLASVAFGHRSDDKGNSAALQQVQALNETIGKLNAEIAALKTSTERSAKADASQLAKITDRVEKVEKAQAEPAGKLAKLTETVEKMRVAAAAPVASAPTGAAAKENPKEATASIPTPVAAPNRAAEANRLPTVQGWRIRNVGNGGALIEGREGLYEVYAGDPLPGLGRVDAIRKQDGRWVVVTSKGLIVAR